jgi:hypothetical protein
MSEVQCRETLALKRKGMHTSLEENAAHNEVLVIKWHDKLYVSLLTVREEHDKA